MYKQALLSFAVLIAGAIYGAAGQPAQGRATIASSPPTARVTGSTLLRREWPGGAELPPPPLVTTAPSKLQPQSDPVFSFPNTRANTDATTYAQQEPSLAVNPTNPLNIISSAKDERRAPTPNTNTKQ